MAINYDDVVRQLTGAGLILPGGRIEVGTARPVRCFVDGGGREKRGWYRLAETRLALGDEVIVGSYGVWIADEPNARKIELGRHELTADQRTALKRVLAENNKSAAAQRSNEARVASRTASRVWAQLALDGESTYLVRKGVQAFGIRFSKSGAIAVPMLDTAGTIHGLQIIRSADAVRKERRPAKEYWPAGLAKRGHFHLIGRPGSVILIAEGYATGATLHQATGIAVAVAFDAGNLLPVAEALHKRYATARILICADDDAFASCKQPDCHQRFILTQSPVNCPACGVPHKRINTGVTAASAAALAVRGAWIAPAFLDVEARNAAFLDRGEKLTDFNDLAAQASELAVSTQIALHLAQRGWRVDAAAANTTTSGAGGEELKPVASLDAMLRRYTLVYGMGGVVFDHQEHRLVALSDMRDACLTRDLHRAWSEHPDRHIVREEQVGFDPTEADDTVTCNLFARWPTKPRAGRCQHLLDLLRYMCNADAAPDQLYQWILKWLAYPIQFPGAKMKSALVLHGPQGTGKNLFFETYMAIYGRYGMVIDQTSVEDKFNDWASRKLFLIADEVVARSDLYHVKNKLKAFITGDWIRINAKNIQAYNERNHVNIVFLSNEVMPVVLEEDDRRHCIVWTPDALTRDRYEAVIAERDAGGVAALHDYLLHLDLGEFTHASRPPMTSAKADLIDLSRDSTSRFYFELNGGNIEGVVARPALTVDVFELYKLWCSRTNNRAAPQQKLVSALQRHHKVRGQRERYTIGSKLHGPHGVLWLGDTDVPPDQSRSTWLGDEICRFRDAVENFRDLGASGKSIPSRSAA